jgi:hypothetical protein
MPAKINMFISNGNPTAAQLQAIQVTDAKPVPKAPSALSASMIGRIHNVKPGCGGCGRG